MQSRVKEEEGKGANVAGREDGKNEGKNKRIE